MTRPPRPWTYADPEAARAYVAAVLRSRHVSAALGPVYVSLPPAVAALPRWPELRETLAALLPGVPLALLADVGPAVAGMRRAERSVYLAATHRAVVVVALREVTRRPLGPGQVAEARAFTGQERPVIVFTGRRLAAWPDCRTHPVPVRRGRPLAAWLDVPAAPPRPLSTLAASLAVLGIRDPAAVARASAGVSDGPTDPPPADARPPLPRPPAPRSGPPGGRSGPPRKDTPPAMSAWPRHSRPAPA